MGRNIDGKNSNELWQKINWKGEINQSKISEDLSGVDSLAKKLNQNHVT